MVGPGFQWTILYTFWCSFSPRGMGFNLPVAPQPKTPRLNDRGLALQLLVVKVPISDPFVPLEYT
jgi:hypothetical protein